MLVFTRLPTFTSSASVTSGARHAFTRAGDMSNPSLWEGRRGACLVVSDQEWSKGGHTCWSVFESQGLLYLAAKRTALRERRGSSLRVTSGSSGVSTTRFFKSRNPLPVKSSTWPSFTL